MLNLEQIGYLLYMESQEKKEKEDQEKVNVELEDDLERLLTTTNKRSYEKDTIPKYYPPL